MVVVVSALVGAITWNLITWYFGLPSSSSHALIGGLIGAGLAAGDAVQWHGVYQKVVIPMIVSPLVGFTLGAILMLIILWIFRSVAPRKVNRGFRFAQVASSAAMAYGHGLQDAQKTMGVIVLALVVSGHLGASAGVPLWVILSAATAISLGTYSGGWRIMRTLGRKVIKMDPAAGFAAQTVASGVLFATASYGLPVSTTHIITSSVMGVGATRRLSAVKWGVAGNIATAWVLTIPAAALVAGVFYKVAHLFVG
jgi:PiT family inorganic phosphate transporter